MLNIDGTSHEWSHAQAGLLCNTVSGAKH